MNALVRLALPCVLLGLSVAGCGDSSGGSSPPTSSSPPAARQQPNQGSANPGPTQGIVAQLTGDPDDQVDPALDDLVRRALARDASDEPLDF